MFLKENSIADESPNDAHSLFFCFFGLIPHHSMFECQFSVRQNENYILKQTMGDSAGMTFRVNHLISSQLLQLHVIYRRETYKLLN